MTRTEALAIASGFIQAARDASAKQAKKTNAGWPKVTITEAEIAALTLVWDEAEAADKARCGLALANINYIRAEARREAGVEDESFFGDEHDPDGTKHAEFFGHRPGGGVVEEEEA